MPTYLDIVEPWTLEQALEFIRGLEPELVKVGFGAGFVGSILVKGRSDKDIDFVVYPRDKSKYDIGEVYATFVAYGMKRVWKRHEVAKFWVNHGSSDTKHVEVWDYKNHRIDVFFLT